MSNDTDMNESKLNAMKVKILHAEQENLKTREKTNDEMVNTILKIIKNESEKVY